MAFRNYLIYLVTSLAVLVAAALVLTLVYG